MAADAAATGRHELTAITGPRAQRCRAIRELRLGQNHGEKYQVSDALHALADLPASNLDACLERALRAPPRGLVSTALDIIGTLDDPRWCDRVYRLFLRVSPNKQLPQPHIWMTSLKFLLRHGYKNADLISALASAGGSEIGEAVLLALEHAPEKALPLIRKSLLDDIPINRMQVAAILALINAPWSKRELIAALDASDDQEKTAHIRAALLETGGEEAQKAVLNWEERNPHEKEAGNFLEVEGRTSGPFYTFSEHALNDRAERMRYEMQELHDRVMKLTSIVPPAPSLPNSWWKLWRS